jgi:hypothetical protein
MSRSLAVFLVLIDETNPTNDRRTRATGLHRRVLYRDSGVSVWLMSRTDKPLPNGRSRTLTTDLTTREPRPVPRT